MVLGVFTQVTQGHRKLDLPRQFDAQFAIEFDDLLLQLALQALLHVVSLLRTRCAGQPLWVA